MHRFGHTLLATLLFSAATASAQQIETHSRSIHLRLIGADAEPIEYKSGKITMVDHTKLHTTPPNGHFWTEYLLHLPDRQFYLDVFPVRLNAVDEGKQMRLRLNASVGTIPFCEGIYHVPAKFEPLFNMWGLEGTEIPEKNIACFEVYDENLEPDWAHVKAGNLSPLLLDGRTVVPNERTTREDPRITRDWERESIIFYLPYSGLDSGEISGKSRLYFDQGSGVQFTSRLQQTRFSHDPSIIDQFFATPTLGWRVNHDVRSFTKQIYNVDRTTDGGMTWRRDEAMTGLGIFHAVPRGANRAWFLGIQLTGDSTSGLLRLYTGTREGKEMQSVEWPSAAGCDGLFIDPAGSVRMIPLGSDDLIILHSGESKKISFRSGADRVIQILGTIHNSYSGPDGTIWLTVEDGVRQGTLGSLIPSYRGRNYRFHRLLRVSSDGLSTRENIISTTPFVDIAFANAARGAILGRGNFLLLTEDAGKSWRYLPIEPIEGGHITMLWPDSSTLRIVTTAGYRDINVDDLPPMKYCAKPEQRSFNHADID